MLLSIELANLKRALDRGGKYASELAAVKKAGGGNLNLAVLETAQNSGVPSLGQLLTEFRTLAYKMLDAESEPTDAGVLERMLSGAKSVVRVRKVDHAPGDKSAPKPSLAAWNPPSRKAASATSSTKAKNSARRPSRPAADWLKKIEARFAIDKSLTDLEASLKNALAGTSASATDAKKGTN